MWCPVPEPSFTPTAPQTYTLLPNWSRTGGPPTDQLVGSGTLNSVNGDFEGDPVGLYAAELPLEVGKTVAFVALPDTGALHIFAMSIG